MYALIDEIEDIPVTRRKENLTWGIECPIDSEHVIYVWFDALINYYTFAKFQLYEASFYPSCALRNSYDFHPPQPRPRTVCNQYVWCK